MTYRRILVCGGRDFDNYPLASCALNLLRTKHPIAVIIHGAARGADTLAARWAMQHGIKAEPYPADWDTHGKGAGHIRNAIMLAQGKPHAVVAFPGGTGTKDMLIRALAAGLPIWEPFKS